MNKDRILKTFMDYAKISSPSYKEHDFANAVISDLEKLGAEIYVDNAGNKCESNQGNIIAYFKGSLPGEPLMLSAHLDTVLPCENIEPVIIDGKITSKGETILSSDDKAGITAIIEAIRYTKENKIPHRNLEVVFTICEEVGLLGSKYLDYSKINSKICYVLDSDGHPGTVTVKSPAHANIKAEFIGLAKHAGLEPEKGISAIQIAAHAINNMRLLRIDSESSANVGTIHGGKADNIVADSCKVTFELRSLNSDKLKVYLEEMLTKINESAKHFGGSVNVVHEIEYDAVSIDLNSEVIRQFKKACDKCGFEFNPESSGGGADSSNFFGKGIQAVTVGVGMSQVHSVNEYILIDDLINSVKLVQALITE